MDLLRRTPPKTKRERKVRTPNTELDHLILQVVQAAEAPLTAHQVVVRTGARRQDVWQRLSLLEHRGLVHRTWTSENHRGPGSCVYSVTAFIG